ncbi:glycosyltransferase family 4 protein [Thermophilibacter provencensis]|uniref:Glycosyltransferase family 1 protein n=1 Tax=Thermophilibacter provencensis TaxID=1852386 RepID=A0ABT7V4Q7_9ACTN|nr:glycosyltransferase family 1 protein [Thermophilibacter provencensis]MDM8271580.1 glycosyltransferase family 1 protein [Thermophilibacter provencensis]
MRYAINGKFLSESITGMQRYAREVLCQLDTLCSPGELILVVPQDAKDIPQLNNIEVVQLRGRGGIPWEQLTLPLWLRRHKLPCVNMLSVVPILYPHGLIVAHGVNYKVNPQFFVTLRDKLSRFWHIANFWVQFNRTEKILTDTEFSKREIISTYHVSPQKIRVSGCGWQHIQRILPAKDTFERYSQIAPGSYFFSMSSVTYNKNFKWIAQVAQYNPEEKFAIAGGRNLERYFDDMGVKQPDNLFFLGYVSDQDAKTLLMNCKAFLFPTYYEGFGIPPMEALACGAQAIVSDTDTMHEVYGSSVHYIDPDNPQVCLSNVLAEKVAPAKTVLDNFSWDRTATELYAYITKEC